MKLYVDEVNIYEGYGRFTKGLYIINEDSTYRHWVFIDGRCATAYNDLPDLVSYTFINDNPSLILEK